MILAQKASIGQWVGCSLLEKWGRPGPVFLISMAGTVLSHVVSEAKSHTFVDALEYTEISYHITSYQITFLTTDDGNFYSSMIRFFFVLRR